MTITKDYSFIVIPQAYFIVLKSLVRSVYGIVPVFFPIINALALSYNIQFVFFRLKVTHTWTTCSFLVVFGCVQLCFRLGVTPEDAGRLESAKRK